MIRIGIAGIPHSAKGKGTEAGIERLRALGLEAMELQFGRNVYMTVEAAAASAIVAKKEDISLSVHAPSALGASVVTIHAAREVLPDVVVASFRDIVKALKKENMTVSLGLETMGDEGEFGSLDEVLEVVRKVPGTTVVIDVAHIYSRTDGGLKRLADFEEIFDRVDKVKKGGYHIHFSGIEHKNSREVRHLPLGEGGPDMDLFARALTLRKQDATVICESPLLEEDALKLQKAFASASGSDNR